MKWFYVLAAIGYIANVQAATTLSDKLKGGWKLTSVTCKGVPQKLENDYTLTFEGATGSYISKNKTCTQVEPETYKYLSEKTLSLKAGIRKCDPTPCAADLAATECGKETNPHEALFDVGFGKEGTMTLTTNDPKSVDCVGPGQSKPAVFTFSRR